MRRIVKIIKSDKSLRDGENGGGAESTECEREELQLEKDMGGQHGKI